MDPLSRRKYGFLIGFGLGLAYSLVTNTVNRLLFLDLNLYDPKPGWLIMILASAFLAGILGLITVWSEETFIGLLISSLLGSLVSLLWTFIRDEGSIIILLLAFFVFLPRLFMFFPLGIAVHWIIHQHQRVFLEDKRNPGKVIVPILCFVLAILAGLFSIYPKDARFALVSTDQLIQQGLKSVSFQGLPDPLKDVSNFLILAEDEYSLEVSYEPDRLPVRRPVAQYGKLVTLIIVRFSNGFMMGCVFTPPSVAPACGNFNQFVLPIEISGVHNIGW